MIISSLRFMQQLLAVAIVGCLIAGLQATVSANSAFPVITDINASGGPMHGGQTDVFDDTNIAVWDETGNFMNNEILVATFNGISNNAGLGITVPISNGENGITSTDGGNNIDIDNPTPVNPAIAAANGGGRLSNGNIIRASVWMRSDPNDPATGVGAPGAASMPQIEGIFKIEMWKEALSGFADFDGPGDSDYGDRIWDQDQQGGAGSNVDINGDGFAGGFGQTVTATLNTESWTQFIVEYEVDDTPANPGNTFSPWFIGSEQFTVADVEEIRAVFYTGDFTGNPGTDFTGGGSWWMDNFLIEVFTDQAAANLVDPTSTNPAPIETAGQLGDFDGDLDVDGQDFLRWQQDGLSAQDLTDWRGEYGTQAPAVLGAVSSVPEPSSVALVVLSLVCFGGTKRRR